mgnify:CR=1 FL=1
MRTILTALLVPCCLVAGIGVLLLAPGPLLAQNSESLANQLDRLQRDVQVLSRQVFKNGVASPSIAAPAIRQEAPASAGSAYIIRVEDRLSQLEGETRSNTGNVENITHTLSQISARLDTLSNDINFRLQAIENRLNVISRNPLLLGQGAGQPDASGAIAPPKLAAVPQAAGVQSGVVTGGSALTSQPGALGTISQTDLNVVQGQASLVPTGQANQPAELQKQAAVIPSLLPAGSVQEQYKYAFGLVRKTEYERASMALSEFIKTHPDEPLTSNAQYWLGRTYYVRKDYRRAAEVFLASYQGDPKGSKAADNLLNLGMSLVGLNKNIEACATYRKLQLDFPKASTVILKRLAQQKTRAECG